MLIDLILDRRAGDEYSASGLYNYCQEVGAIFGDLYLNVARAMDWGDEMATRWRFGKVKFNKNSKLW